MARQYKKIPIVDAARRCGLVLDPRTLNRSEVEASCPFCGDRGTGKFHLSLRTKTDQFRCILCGESGNSVSLYAKINGVTNRQAFQALESGGNLYPMPQQPVCQLEERKPASTQQRHDVYSEMLSFLTLSEKHRENLLERGLSERRITENGYKSMPETPQARRLLATLVESSCDLLGIPGFYTQHGVWTVAGPRGFFIPVRDQDGLIQGLKLRKDADEGGKYRWFSSCDRTDGTNCRAYVHITGDVTQKRAFLTEGPLKGDVASFLASDALFVCIGGVGATGLLKETLTKLGVYEVVEAMDMDQLTKPEVRKAVLNMRHMVQTIPHIQYKKYTWDPAYNGIDNYLLSRAAAG